MTMVNSRVGSRPGIIPLMPVGSLSTKVNQCSQENLFSRYDILDTVAIAVTGILQAMTRAAIVATYTRYRRDLEC